MNPKFGRRPWIKLWVHEWLNGTTRLEMSDGQRAFWVDLLAMAGQSRYPGTVCAGLSGEKMVGYPIKKFEGMLSGPMDVEATLALFVLNDKIRVTVTQQEPIKLVLIEVINWNLYQSEYQRQKPYRDEAAAAVKTPKFELPSWVPETNWAGFMEMRKRKRAPNTNRALNLAVKKLDALRRQGFPPDTVLDQSTERGWTGLFPLREERQDHRNGKLSGQALLDQNLRNLGFGKAQSHHS